MQIIDLGLTDFLDAYKIQVDFVKKVYFGLCENTLLITEHKPVITIGRSGLRSNILKSEEYLSRLGIDIFEVDRGGDVTYHSTGQIIAYPVFKLDNEAKDIHAFLRYLEEIGRHFLFQYGICSGPLPGLRGVWVDNRKICSIGIGVKKWVTCHGMAINVNLDLTPFSFIRPCGIEGVEMTSIREILGSSVDINDAKQSLIESFKEISLLAEAVSKS